MVKRSKHTDDPQQWLLQVAELRPQKDVAVLQDAINLYEPNDNLLRKGVYIADVLLSLGLDTDTISAALAYPALKSHEIHIDTITDCLGETSRKLLHDVLQMQALGKLQQLESRGHHQVENLRKMLLAMVTDVRAVLVVLVERIWQLHEAKESSIPDQQKLAHETLAVFAPLANRLGVWQLKWEMEDLCLRYLEPEVYNTIAKSLASKRQEREAYIQSFITIVTDLLQGAHIPRFEISGRVKHIYSIYGKMKRKNASIEAIYDISAIRILVPDIADCYAVLSILQNQWQQVLAEFDDYISQPKPNGYRSIHTVVLGPQERYVEVQIRTYQMHEESELGVAAHWQYKEGVLQASSYEAKIALLRQIIAWQKEVVGANDNKQSTQDLFADRIYVFTPLGDIVDLPKGATPLDFAYQVHSEVGHRCKGAKIDNKLVPLTYQLQTGQRVEILTAKEPNPSRDWLNPHLGYLQTARARAKVQHWFRVKDAMLNIATGRELLEKELKKIGFVDKVDLHALAMKFNYKTADDLLAGLALGDVRMAQVIHQLRPVPLPPLPTHTRTSVIPEQANVQILGVNNLLTQIARCCKPLPGDPIVGYVTRSRGVTIHRRDCNNIDHATKINQERLLEVDWGEKIAGHYPVDLLLIVKDRSGVLRDITALLAGEKINVLGVQTQTGLRGQNVDIFMTIEITNKDQLKKAIGLLQQVKDVVEVRRR